MICPVGRLEDFVHDFLLLVQLFSFLLQYFVFCFPVFPDEAAGGTLDGRPLFLLSLGIDLDIVLNDLILHCLRWSWFLFMFRALFLVLLFVLALDLVPFFWVGVFVFFCGGYCFFLWWLKACYLCLFVLFSLFLFLFLCFFSCSCVHS